LSDAPASHFIYEDDPAAPGWKRWELRDAAHRYNGFLGPIHVRPEGDIVRVRMTPEVRHSNLREQVHGGALLGFIDVSLFAAARGFGVLSAGPAATIDLSVQFVAGGTVGEPLEARIELLRETGRILFLRGLIVQSHGNVASFGGTIRKPAAA